MVTEGTITVNLAMEPAEGDEMSRPPNAPSAPLLGRALLARIGWLGLVITAVTLGYFAWEVSRGRPLPEARTAAFTLLAFCEWANVLNVRSETRSVLSSPVWKNRWLLGGLAASVALPGRSSTGRPSCGSSAPCTCRRADRKLLALLGCTVVLAEEARKAIVRRRMREREPRDGRAPLPGGVRRPRGGGHVARAGGRRHRRTHRDRPGLDRDRAARGGHLPARAGQ